MLVPSSMVNLDGSQCNMVGTGYTAFANQAVCHKPFYFIVIVLAYLCRFFCCSSGMPQAVALHCLSIVTAMYLGLRSNSPLSPKNSQCIFHEWQFWLEGFVRHRHGLAEKTVMVFCFFT